MPLEQDRGQDDSEQYPQPPPLPRPRRAVPRQRHREDFGIPPPQQPRRRRPGIPFSRM